ncbi:MAG TPA: hypothetical protein VKU87_06470 [Thermomicrobiaceae bacterium]|nr:hypothetical protein [Thermomicrobiaceae bacterium]
MTSIGTHLRHWWQRLNPWAKARVERRERTRQHREAEQHRRYLMSQFDALEARVLTGWDESRGEDGR